jgi:hypothetical protein
MQAVPSMLPMSLEGLITHAGTSLDNTTPPTSAVRSPRSIRSARLSASPLSGTVSGVPSHVRSLTGTGNRGKLRLTGPQAMAGVGDQLNELSNSLRIESAIKQQDYARRQQESDSKIKANEAKVMLAEVRASSFLKPVSEESIPVQAIKMFSERESNLSPEAFLAIVDLFNGEGSAATTYIAINNEAMRRAWVQRELGKLNFVGMDL